MIKKIIIPVFLAVSIFPVVVLAGGGVSFGDSKFNTQEGEVVMVPIYLDVSPETIYTAKLVVNFPANLLEVTSFVFASGWIPVVKPGYDELNNNTGELIRTAGIPGGFTGRKLFGNLYFSAERSGAAYLRLGDGSLLLDGFNKNTFSKPSSVAIKISAAPNKVLDVQGVKISVPSGEVLFPSQLFDIRLELDDKELEDSRKLSPSVFFENFGSEPIPVDVHYKILDADSRNIYSGEDSLIVESSLVYRPKFGNLEIPGGRYSLVVQTSYNGGVEDEFVSDFSITALSEGRSSVAWYVWIGFGVVSIILLLVFIWLAKGRKKQI